MKIKKILGNFKRSFLGVLENKFEQPVPPNRSIDISKIGQSIEKRDILCYRVGGGSTKILFMAAIHGNEIGTVKLARQLTNHLFKCQNDYSDFSFYIIPCLNPDGYQVAIEHPDYFGGGRAGRLNHREVDLNRNFQTSSFQSHATWMHGKNYSDATDVFAGPHGNSEPEIASLVGFIKDIKPDLIISFHNAGSDVVGNDFPLAQKVAHLFAAISGYKFISIEEWRSFHQTGSSFEWCTIQKIPLLEIEANSRWSSDWRIQKEAILKVIETVKN